MKNNFKVVITVSVLLVTLSITISTLNFLVSLESTQRELANRSLPLSVDNIYSEIQSHVIGPGLVSSLMSNDTFVRDWLLHEEHNQEKIVKYLAKIKNKFGMHVTFLVSDQTLNYYTHNGRLEVVSRDNPDNQWYFQFRDTESDNEINLDTNSQLDNSLFMFMNYKIFDDNYQLIGVTGIGHKIAYVDEMLKRFRHQFNFKVYFVDTKGKIVISESLQKKPGDLADHPVLGSMESLLIGSESQVIKYTHQDLDYLIKTKFIPELNMHLLVEARLNDFTEDVKNTFIFNLLASLLVTFVVTLLVLMTIKGYNKKLEFLATNDALTKLLNRRAFEENLKKYLHLSKRLQTPLSLLFFDIDDFKAINDSKGHFAGDKVLKRVAEIMCDTLRADDLLGRWGGEEFVVALSNTDTNAARDVAEKLRLAIAQDHEIIKIADNPLTASFGISRCMPGQTIDSAINKADHAMYSSKQQGKNQTTIAPDD